MRGSRTPRRLWRLRRSPASWALGLVSLARAVVGAAPEGPPAPDRRHGEGSAATLAMSTVKLGKQGAVGAPGAGNTAGAKASQPGVAQGIGT